MKLKKIAFLFFCALMLSAIEVNSQQIKDSLNYYRGIANKSKKTTELISAYTYFKKKKGKSLLKKHYSWVVFYEMRISSIQGKLGELHDSENSAIRGLKYLEELPKDSLNISYRVFLENRLGILNRLQRRYEKSLKNFLTIVKIALEKDEVIVAYNNIGNLYISQGNYLKAIENLEKAYSISKSENDEKRIALTLSNLGYAKAMYGNKMGVSYMNEALKIRVRTNDSDIYDTYKNLADYYRFTGDTIKSIFFAEKGLLKAKEFDNIQYLENALKNLLYLNQDKYINEFLNITEKIKSIRLNANEKYAEAKYNYSIADNKRKEAERKQEKAELDKEKEKTKRIQSEARANRNFFIAISILLIALFVYYVLKSRHKKEKLQERFDTERQISKKLHDEVANSIYHTMSKQQNKTDVDIALIDDLEDIYLKARDISKTSAALNISEHFDEDLKDLIWSYKTDSVNIFTRNISEMPWNNLSTLKKETIYRVLQELMTNMKKYSEASVVSLQFEKTSRKIVIHYSDNGIGCVLKKSNGLQNAENRMHEIGGTIIFESEINKGFQVKITV